MNTMNIPGFSAERSLTVRSNRRPRRSRLTEVELMNRIIPAEASPGAPNGGYAAVPVLHCGQACWWEVAGVAPGYGEVHHLVCYWRCWVE
jgi:hypothetical protein